MTARWAVRAAEPTAAFSPQRKCKTVGSSPSPATKQIPKNGLTPPFLGIFPFQKSGPKPGNSDFDPCLTHTGNITENQRGLFRAPLTAFLMDDFMICRLLWLQCFCRKRFILRSETGISPFLLSGILFSFRSA